MHLEIKDSKGDEGELLSHAPSPFGQMQFNQKVAAPGQYQAAPEAPRPTVESLANMYQVSTQMVRFPPKPDEPVTRTILVKNNSLGKLQLEKYGRDINGIEISITKPEFNAGEESEIQLTYDPKTTELAGRYRMDFMLMPISQMFEVFIDF
jgi:hypothetical protein